MITAEEKQALRNCLTDYLRQTGRIRHRSDEFRCPVHLDKHPSMTLAKTGTYCQCWSCGARLDIFDFAKIDAGVQSFPESVEYLRRGRYSPVQPPTQEETEKDYSRDIRLAQGQFRGSPAEVYINRRGISTAVAEEWGCGFFRKRIKKYDNSFGWMRGLMIPRDDGHGYVLRNLDIPSDVHGDERKDKVRRTGRKHVKMVHRLYTEEVAFIVEGEVDGMSVDECGGKAVALGGLDANWLRDYIERHGKPNAKVIVALDNDGAGRMGAEALKSVLEDAVIADAGIMYLGEKDANAALLKHPDEFRAMVQKCIRKRRSM